METPGPPHLSPIYFPPIGSPCDNLPLQDAPSLSPLQLAGFDPTPTPELHHGRHQPGPTPTLLVAQQLKGVNVFTGKGGMSVDDWVRDLRYLLESRGNLSPRASFNEVVRHTGGRARDLILNLELQGGELSAERAFRELLDEYGDGDDTTSPMASFYARLQQASETPSEYAVALEAKLRSARDRGDKAALSGESARDAMLTTQFMYGLRDQKVRARLAPMRPRTMSFRELRKELRVICAEEKLASAQIYRQQVKPKENRESTQELDALVKVVNELAVTQQKQMDMFHQTMSEQQRHLNNLEQRLQGRMTDNGGDKQTRRPPICYKCRERGHFANACPTLQSN